MIGDKWMVEARRYAKHAYCYEGMVDEFPDFFEPEYIAKVDPYEAVDAFAEKCDLDRTDGFYGINSGKTFTKEWKE